MMLASGQVLAVRLYSRPTYQPINNFLRQIAHLQGAFRSELAHHAGLSFAATVRHIVCAVRKLAAVATPEESSMPLWRGVRGELPPIFWVPDETGTVCATDMAFLSTSRSRETPIAYMQRGASSANVLWCLHPRSESDTAYHCGADISMLSQYADEHEILFPPCTMLTVIDPAVQLASSAVAQGADPEGTHTEGGVGGRFPIRFGRLESEQGNANAGPYRGLHQESDGKNFVAIDVIPSFV